MTRTIAALISLQFLPIVRCVPDPLISLFNAAAAAAAVIIGTA